jgi:hypothetical protein
MNKAEDIATEIIATYHNILKDKVTFASFYLQELDGAIDGNSDSKAWAESKGLHPSWYKGALNTDDESADNVQMAIAMKVMNAKGNERDSPNSEKGGSARAKLKRDVVDLIYKRYIA